MNTKAQPVRRSAAAAAAVALSLGLAACGLGDDEDTLVVCTSIPFHPFEFREGQLDEDEESGEEDRGEVSDIVGFDADMMALLADRTDQDVDWLDVRFESIASSQALNANRCDIAAAALSITEERQAAMGMSDPYFRVDQSLVAPTDSSVNSLEDLDGLQVGVQSGSTGEAYAESVADEYGFTPVSFDNMGQVQQALTAGTVDASFADIVAWSSMIERGGLDLEVKESFETNEYYAFAVQRDNTDLLNEVNAMLAEAFESGEYAEIYERWIGEPYEGGAIDPDADADIDIDDEEDSDE
ncbi:ABC transporter substrate-binding protein [Natronoglycomyces albus]|uniref:Amino acid ABC transporter substrate-binding protein n=1 Tax=Natronoglycomyces albus TaxID=2811108 RepID=A0A895XTE8_9ACTN|nr:ABC transporter substrate-binding protein [Natronoglycomyces albus]QSB06763.1 amino acid ABC transporter substrate-binding protein [Natronoglycomyces albus]